MLDGQHLRTSAIEEITCMNVYSRTFFYTLFGSMYLSVEMRKKRERCCLRHFSFFLFVLNKKQTNKKNRTHKPISSVARMSSD